MLIKKETKNNKSGKNTSSNLDRSQPLVKAPTQQPAKPYPQQQAANQMHSDKKPTKTRIFIKYDVGFSNQLYIRGKGANLSWDKGQPLKNVNSDEWIWETDANFTHCEFKILINDHVYENGENHQLKAGSNYSYTPHFY